MLYKYIYDTFQIHGHTHFFRFHIYTHTNRVHSDTCTVYIYTVVHKDTHT